MARIQLFFKHTTEVVGNEREGLLILTDAFQERQLVIPCHGLQLLEMKERLGSVHKPNKLVDVLWKVINWQTSLDFEIVITSVTNGEYVAILNNKNTLDQISISATDGVLLNYLSKEKVPLYMDEKLFLRQSSAYDTNARGLSIPVNCLSVPMLKNALNNALTNENYELASQLRDEINKRNESHRPTSGNIGES